MNKTPLISVFIPYYNDSEYLKESIQSVLDQDYKNFELILLNHASTDNSREIAHSFHDKRIIHIDMPKNYGAGGGILFKKMLDTSRGKYIKPLCADDKLNPQCLKEMSAYLEHHPKIDFIFCDIEYIDEKGKSLDDSWFKARPHFSTKNKEIELLKLYRDGIQTLPYIGSMAKRQDLLKIQYDPSLIMLFDMSVWLQLLLLDKKVAYIPKCLANYRCHTGQISSLSNEKIGLRRSYFERVIFRDFFAKSKNVDLIKKTFFAYPLVSRLTNGQDIPFIIYHSYFFKNEQISDALQLGRLLSNEEYRQHLIKQFNYDVNDYRKEYSYPITLDSKKEIEEKNQKKTKVRVSTFKKIKHKIYSKNVRRLNLVDLSFLVLRQIFEILALDYLRRKRKHKYSL